MGHSVCLGGGSEVFHGKTRTCDACDTCPRESGRRMRWDRCPAGWCGDFKLCSGCPPLDHAACAEAASRRQTVAATEAALLDAGEYIRRSAVSIHGTDEVRVWFRNRDGVDLVAEVTKATYRAQPLGEPKTPADYGIEPDELIPAERFAGMAPWMPRSRA